MCMKFHLTMLFNFISTILYPEHQLGLSFAAFYAQGDSYRKTYFSVGGGFIKEEGIDIAADSKSKSKLPCHDGETILQNCQKLNMTVSQLVMLNESTWYFEVEIRQKALYLWDEMKDAIWRGSQRDGILPGSAESQTQSE